MDSVFTFEETVSEVALYIYCAVFNTGIFGLKKVCDCNLIFVSFCPTYIHTHKHLRPILAFSTAGTGVYFQDSTHYIAFTTEHIAQFKIFEHCHNLSVSLIYFSLAYDFFLIEIHRKIKLIDSFLKFTVISDPFLEVLYFFHLPLCALGVIPEAGSHSAELFFFYLYFLVVDVKDTSSAPACAQKSLLIVPG